jgi:hypothetical protein
VRRYSEAARPVSGTRDIIEAMVHDLGGNCPSAKGVLMPTMV